MALYHALIGDIRGSRNLEDRQARQYALQGILKQADQEFHREVLSSFVFTGGDEFKALFASGEGAFRCTVWITRRSDLPLRFGMGVGTLDVGAPGDPPGGLDGPCFHRAREAVESARRRKHWIAVRGYTPNDREAFDNLMNAALALLGRVQETWTKRQKEYVMLVESLGTVKAAAESAGVSPPAVSEALKTAKWDEVRDLEKQVALVLSRVDERL